MVTVTSRKGFGMAEMPLAKARTEVARRVVNCMVNVLEIGMWEVE